MYSWLNDEKSFEIVKESHGHYPKKFINVTPTEDEFCKYFNNIYNATLITLANSFYEVCKANGVDYRNVKNAIASRDHINNLYLDCNENFRGFGGVCLPKDTKAIDALCKELNAHLCFIAHGPRKLEDHNGEWRNHESEEWANEVEDNGQDYDVEHWIENHNGIKTYEKR